jgi:hypothetical protein
LAELVKPDGKVVGIDHIQVGRSQCSLHFHEQRKTGMDYCAAVCLDYWLRGLIVTC